MRQSQLFVSTLRENPAEADAISHQLSLRAGLIRQSAAGLYSFLPLGYRVLRKIETIVREEMDAIGAQEVLLPIIQSETLWQESGRAVDYGDLMFRLGDRHHRSMVLGPTHEEVITSLVHQEIRSYRQLPFILYQIHTKFRDEARPRGGLLRLREFRMKDAYSFELDELSLSKTYQQMYDAYCHILNRLGVRYKAVEADPGAIGGQGGTHEFMVLSPAGEDTMATCPHCAYSANLEKACSRPLAQSEMPSHAAVERVDTKDATTIMDLVRQLHVDASQIIKVIVYAVDDHLVAACLRGDHEVNELKLKYVCGASHVELASAKEVLRATGRPVGFVHPGVDLPIIFDRDVLSIDDGVMAAEEIGFHLLHAVPNRDFAVSRTEDIRRVTEGDTCVHCGAELQFYRGIEVGHIFKLGTRYTEVFDAGYLDENGVRREILMGCYGFGTSRLIPAIIEQCHDDDGIVWPMSVAPYHVHIVPVNMRDDLQVQTALKLCQRLEAAGVEVLLDDRDERPGVKFKDADLIGLPIRITVGNRIREGHVELGLRKSHDVQVLSLEKTFETVLSICK